jgi:uncharacterized protein (UPF0332 family)
MNPRDFLDVAFDLAGEFREADWRSAVSRAYYAAFHVATEFLQRCGFAVPQGEPTHGYLWLRLANSGEAALQNAGNELRRLRTARNWADYTLARPLTQMHAADHARLAENIIRTLDQIATMSALLTQSAERMRTYERDVLQDITWRGPTSSSSNGGGATDGT